MRQAWWPQIVGPPVIGGVSGKIWLRHRNLTGFGDAVYFSYSVTDGLDDFYGSYDFPLTSYDTHLNLYYQNSESDVVENPFDEAAIRSRSETFGISLAQPFYRTPGQIFSMSLAFEYRRSKTFIGNEPFPFALGVPTEGDNKGESKISVIRFTQDWLDRSQTQVIAARSTFNLGIHALGATNNSELPDGQFFCLAGSISVDQTPAMAGQSNSFPNGPATGQRSVVTFGKILRRRHA